MDLPGAPAGPAWTRVSDAYVRLLVAWVVDGDAGEAAPGFAEAVAGLPVAQADERAASIFDLGRILGRHGPSKAIQEDDLRQALATLDAELRKDGWGGLEVDDVFHRRADVRFAPSEAWGEAASSAGAAWVAGLVTGALEVGFNCQVDINIQDPYRFELRLGEGRDVNQEATSVGRDPGGAAGDP